MDGDRSGTVNPNTHLPPAGSVSREGQAAKDGVDAGGLTGEPAGIGDGAVDSPFSIFAWVNQTATTGIKAIFSKFDTAGTLREYQLVLDAAEKLRFRLYDESSDGYIGRLYNTALGTGSILFVAATYDGSGGSAGIRLFSAGAVVDDTDDNSGTYTAMENLATVGRVYSSGSGTPAEYFSGTGYGVGLVAKALTYDDIWALKTAGNGYYDLTL